jgi:hypothetical protein
VPIRPNLKRRSRKTAHHSWQRALSSLNRFSREHLEKRGRQYVGSRRQTTLVREGSVALEMKKRRKKELGEGMKDTISRKSMKMTKRT